MSQFWIGYIIGLIAGLLAESVGKYALQLIGG